MAARNEKYCGLCNITINSKSFAKHLRSDKHGYNVNLQRTNQYLQSLQVQKSQENRNLIYEQPYLNPIQNVPQQQLSVPRLKDIRIDGPSQRSINLRTSCIDQGSHYIKPSKRNQIILPVGKEAYYLTRKKNKLERRLG